MRIMFEDKTITNKRIKRIKRKKHRKEEKKKRREEEEKKSRRTTEHLSASQLIYI